MVRIYDKKNTFPVPQTEKVIQNLRCRECGGNLYKDTHRNEIICENGHVLKDFRHEVEGKADHGRVMGYIRCVGLVGKKRNKRCNWIVPIFDRDPFSPQSCPKCGKRYVLHGTNVKEYDEVLEEYQREKSQLEPEISKESLDKFFEGI